MTRDPSDLSKSWIRLILNTFLKKQKFQKLSFLRLCNTFYDKNDPPSQKKVIKIVRMLFNHWKGSWFWGIGASVQLPLTFQVFSKVLWCSGEVREEVKILKNFFSKSLCTWSIINENTLRLVLEQRRTTRQQKLKIFQVLTLTLLFVLEDKYIHIYSYNTPSLYVVSIGVTKARVEKTRLVAIA